MTEKTRQLVDAAMADPSRTNTITAIRAVLKERSGKVWSVTGGTGTAWGWIRILSVPMRRDEHGAMTDADRDELTRLLGHDRPIHHQGESIPAASDFRRVAIQQAAYGSANGETATAYWD
jgi:hypothetical protein